jgi:hypothetical protein
VFILPISFVWLNFLHFRFTGKIMSKKRKNDPKPVAGSNTEVSINQLSPPLDTEKVSAISYLKSHFWLVGVICFVSLGVLGAGLKYLDEDAKREIVKRGSNKGNISDRKDESFLNKINPFLPAALPSPTPQLSKEYIYAGQRLLAVEDTNATAAPPADLAIWRPSTGYWWVMNPNGTVQANVGWGLSGDDPVEGDYDGDGKTDFAVYRKVTGQTSEWWIMRSSDNSYFSTNFGLETDIPAQADFDGDGRTDAALFRPGTGTWYIIQSSNLQIVQGQFGQSGDIPAPADYDGDGKADIGVWRGSPTYAFYSLNSSNNGLQTPTFGSTQSGDKIVSSDFDGDGRADYAVYNSSSSNWYIRQSSNGQVVSYTWGTANDIPVQNDYDGDGKVDIAVWHDANGLWTIRNSSNPSQPRTVTWGQHLDLPVPAFYRR